MNGRIPVWTSRLPELKGCVGLAYEEWGCTETARFVLGFRPLCADCFVRELGQALFASKLLGGDRAMDVEQVSA